jgi:hypothetical protein
MWLEGKEWPSSGRRHMMVIRAQLASGTAWRPLCPLFAWLLTAAYDPHQFAHTGPVRRRAQGCIWLVCLCCCCGFLPRHLPRPPGRCNNPNPNPNPPPALPIGAQALQKEEQQQQVSRVGGAWQRAVPADISWVQCLRAGAPVQGSACKLLATSPAITKLCKSCFGCIHLSFRRLQYSCHLAP